MGHVSVLSSGVCKWNQLVAASARLSSRPDKHWTGAHRSTKDFFFLMFGPDTVWLCYQYLCSRSAASARLISPSVQTAVMRLPCPLTYTVFTCRPSETPAALLARMDIWALHRKLMRAAEWGSCSLLSAARSFILKADILATSVNVFKLISHYCHAYRRPQRRKQRCGQKQLKINGVWTEVPRRKR